MFRYIGASQNSEFDVVERSGCDFNISRNLTPESVYIKDLDDICCVEVIEYKNLSYLFGFLKYNADCVEFIKVDRITRHKSIILFRIDGTNFRNYVCDKENNEFVLSDGRVLSFMRLPDSNYLLGINRCKYLRMYCNKGFLTIKGSSYGDVDYSMSYLSSLDIFGIDETDTDEVIVHLYSGYYGSFTSIVLYDDYAITKDKVTNVNYKFSYITISKLVMEDL